MGTITQNTQLFLEFTQQIINCKNSIFTKIKTTK